MCEKIEYRYETKEEQIDYWERCEKNAALQCKDDLEDISQYQNNCKKSDFDYVIDICRLDMRNYILYNNIEAAKVFATTGTILLEKNRDELQNYIEFLHEFDWLLNGKENKQYIEDTLLSYEKYISSSDADKYYYIYATLSAIQCQEYKKAQSYIKNVYTVKPRSRLNESVIYHLERFYAFIAEYLCDTEKNADMLPKLIKCFKFLFDESQKGSYKLYDRNCIDLIQRDHIFGLRYIWYKYFSGRDWDTISFVEIVQSERYGVKGLQDC